MRVLSKDSLYKEIFKIQAAVEKKDSDALKTYYDDYLSSLTVPSRELFHAGCFTMYTEVISYHLLSMYLLLDLIDYYWDGKKFLNHKMEKKPSLWHILSGDSATSFKQIEKMKKTLFTLQRLSRKHRLHVFLIPLKSKNDYSLEITYPGNVLIIFPKSSKSDNKGEQPKIVDVLQRGICEFYYKKELREILPRWADTYEIFQHEFIKWCNDVPSKFTARKMN